jgi:hypothetical protein
MKKGRPRKSYEVENTEKKKREENPDKKENLEYLRQPGLVGDIEKVHPAPVRPVYSHNLNIQNLCWNFKKIYGG